MEEKKSFAKEYTRNKLIFSCACLSVVLIVMFIALNARFLGMSKDGVFGIAIAGAGLLYFLKLKIWKCPACGFSFEMGGYKNPGRWKSSRLASCPKCSASFE